MDHTDCGRLAGWTNLSPSRLDAVTRHGTQAAPDPRENAKLKKVRDIYIPDLHIVSITVKGRNFH